MSDQPGSGENTPAGGGWPPPQAPAPQQPPPPQQPSPEWPPPQAPAPQWPPPQPPHAGGYGPQAGYGGHGYRPPYTVGGVPGGARAPGPYDPYGRYGYGYPSPWSTPAGPPPRPITPPRSFRGWTLFVAAVVVVGAIVGGGVASAFTSRASQTIIENVAGAPGGKVVLGNVQAVLGRVLPAVVSIDTSSYRGTGAFHGYVEGAGTGMIISPDGTILTNNHVIAGATRITVTLYGQTGRFPASVIGTDPAHDVALIRVSGTHGRLPVVAYGDSTAVQQGDGVLAIGNALALAGGPSVTEGIVSAKGRSLTTTNSEGTLTEHLTGLLQTDAPINPGNSGGPLVDSSARVIGMNTAVAESSAGNAPAQNIGFAIGVDAIRPIVSRLLATYNAMHPS
jgi:S1-C subfamily serine protease